MKSIPNIGLENVQAVYGGPEGDLYLDMLNKQFTYDALRIIGFDMALMQAMGGEMAFMQQLAHAGKIAQAIFIAPKRK